MKSPDRAVREALPVLLPALALFCFWASGEIFLRMIGAGGHAGLFTSLRLWLRADELGAVTRQILFLSSAAPAAASGLVLFALLREPEPALHGDARFATGTEIARAGLSASPKETEPRILFGRSGKKLLGLTGPGFLLLSAPTRSGKGVGVVIPNCLYWKGSLVVLDIKGENFALTSAYRKAALGNRVFRFSPFSPDGRTHAWNPLDAVPEDPALRTGDVDSIASSLYPAPSGNSDPFWATSARELFRGLALLTLETPGVPHTMAQILAEASGDGRPLREYLKERLASGRHSEACRSTLNRILGNADQTLSSIAQSCTTTLAVFQNPLVRAATSHTSPGLDLASVRRRPVTVYLVIPPDRIEEARVVVNLFFNQLISLNTRRLPEEDPGLSVPCLLLLDEFPAVGRIPLVANAVSYIAGYGLRLLTIIQNRSQLEDVYGKQGAVTLEANHAALVIFAPSPSVTADARAYSELLGYRTVKKRRVTRSKKGGGSVSDAEERRALLLPQEVQRLPEDTEIVSLPGMPPVRCRKIRYYSDPVLSKRLFGSTEKEVPVQPPEAGAPPELAPGSRRAGSRAPGPSFEDRAETDFFSNANQGGNA